MHGAEVPQPYGGKPRVIMADLDQRALNAHDLSLSDVSDALQRRTSSSPGDVKIGAKDYTLTMNNSPNVIDRINAFPIKEIDGRTVFMRDIAHVHDGFRYRPIRFRRWPTRRPHHHPQDRGRLYPRRHRRHPQGAAE